jgi:hypothetical protein
MLMFGPAWLELVLFEGLELLLLLLLTFSASLNRIIQQVRAVQAGPSAIVSTASGSHLVCTAQVEALTPVCDVHPLHPCGYVGADDS